MLKRSKSTSTRLNKGKKLKQYTDTSIRLAVEALLAGATMKGTIQHFQVPATTLRLKYLETVKQLSQNVSDSITVQSSLDTIGSAASPESGFQELTSLETSTLDILQSYCCACFSQNTDDLQMMSEKLVKTLKKFINDDKIFEDFEVSDLSICSRCSQVMVKMEEFIENCVDSLRSLKIISERSCDETESTRNEEINDDVNDLILDDDSSSDIFEEDCKFCSLCEMFIDEPITQHIIQRHTVQNKQRQYVCKECDKSLLHNQSMLIHIHNEHVKFKMATKCPGCDLVFIYRKAFWNHLASHAMDFICDICQQRFSSKRKIREHIENTHLIQKTCLDCKQMFFSQNEFQVHLKSHTNNNNQLICETCGKKYKSEISLNKHIKEVW